MGDAALLICTRVADLSHPIAGSTAERCRTCGLDVWVSPKSRDVLNENGLEISCTACATTDATEPIKLQPMTPGQAGELDAHQRRN